MERKPLKRSQTPLKRTPLKPISKKRQALQRQRRIFVNEIMSKRLRCEAGRLVMSVQRDHRCGITPSDVHEPLTRARGGDILDPDNALAVCRPCHDWIHDHPASATYLGLLRRAEPKDD